MQKIIRILVMIVLLPLLATAQEESFDDQSGVNDFFPQTGHFGIGLDATPFLNYLGNMANGTLDNALNLGDNTLYFRYFIMDDAAIRLSFRVRHNTTSTTFLLADDNALINDPLSNRQVEDRRITVDNDYVLRAGYQHFIGQNRLRGFAGADIGYGYFKNHFLYEYGNTMNEVNPNPTHVVNWFNGATGNASERPLETVNNVSNMLMAGAFTGVEFYVMPRFAIGLEMGLLYSLAMPGKRYEVSETMVGSLYVENTLVTGRGNRINNFISSNPYSYGNLYLFFHF